ncbi:MAG: glycosyltransferase family 2 protein [Myxococcales bacterium]|nr:glycosyltransferase family 2 protein [Myxococcales bacterium]
MPDNVIDLSVVILSFNTRAHLLECLESVEREICGPDMKRTSEVIVVDNGSNDGSVSALRENFSWVDVIALKKNIGYARGNNLALARTRGRIVLLLNSDVVLEPGSIETTFAFLEEHPQVGAAGIQLIHPDGRLQNSIHRYPSFPREVFPVWLLETLVPGRFPSKRRPVRAPIEVESVLGAVLFVRREVLERVGLLPEAYFFFLEETDWCWQMRRAGFSIYHIPGARALHHSGASSKKKDPIATRIEYHRSLYHFLRVNRGVSSATGVRALRILKGLVSIPPLALLAVVSPYHRMRLRSVGRLLLWHAIGCPASWGLSESAPSVG